MNNNQIKFHIHIPGDSSVGIQDFNSKVTIEDDGIYDTKELVEELKNSVNDIYGNEGIVLTELEFAQKRLQELDQELSMAKDAIDDREPVDPKRLQHYEFLRKEVKMAQNKVKKLQRKYDRMKFWYEGQKNS